MRSPATTVHTSDFAIWLMIYGLGMKRMLTKKEFRDFTAFWRNIDPESMYVRYCDLYASIQTDIPEHCVDADTSTIDMIVSSAGHHSFCMNRDEIERLIDSWEAVAQRRFDHLKRLGVPVWNDFQPCSIETIKCDCYCNCDFGCICRCDCSNVGYTYWVYSPAPANI